MTDWEGGPVRLLAGDCRLRLRELPDASVDALVTDPPAGIGFMGKEWDDFRGSAPTVGRQSTSPFLYRSGSVATGRDGFIAFMTDVAAECLRVLKPGAHGLVWAIPRTSHWTATALEDAGFEIRDVVHHHFGSGFPKSLDVSKAIDKAAKVEGTYGDPKSEAHAGWIARGRMRGDDGHEGYQRPWMQDEEAVDRNARQYLPATEAARQWEGWGTALKPATEHWILIRRPLGELNVAANVLAHGTGALNVDRCRIGTTRDVPASLSHSKRSDVLGLGVTAGTAADLNPNVGRWPANLVFSHAEGCQPAGTRRVASNSKGTAGGNVEHAAFGGGMRNRGNEFGYADADGLETVEAWECVEGCPVAELDRQSAGIHPAGSAKPPGGWQSEGGWGFIGKGEFGGARYGDTGGASRFFYTAKASSSERNAGLYDQRKGRNRHPTVKPLDLMRWLCRLVTPPGGLVLDCFAGSGTTLVAAKLEGFRAIGIEQDPESVETAIRRLAWAAGHQADLLEPVP